VLPRGGDQVKKARLIQPNPLPPALGTLLAVHAYPGAIQFFKQVGTVGVLRKPRRRGHLRQKKTDRPVDAITFRSEIARNLLRMMGRLNSRCTEGLLLNRGHAPHMVKMTLQKIISKSDKTDHNALARWEDEGGSSITSAERASENTANGRSKRTAWVPRH
jgi:hypothetical protein